MGVKWGIILLTIKRKGLNMEHNYQYKICQLIDIKECGYGFMPYDFAKKHGFSFGDYLIVYDGFITANSKEEALENLYMKFNIDRPEDFKGHSLSVSDIIELDGEACYCDPAGWVIGI